MKLVLITGASRGIGAEIARVFSQNNYFVAVNYNKSFEKAKELCDELTNCQSFKADISSQDEIKQMYLDIEKAFGKMPDVLINNAGISQSGLFTETTQKDFDDVFDINVKGVYLCTKFALDAMISKKYGKIINISSMWGQTGASCEVLYSASKAAVIGLTKALAKEVAPCGINVNCIAPGVVMTDMLSSYSEEDLGILKQETPLLRLGTPLDIANAALFLASDSSSFITGQILGVNGGFLI